MGQGAFTTQDGCRLAYYTEGAGMPVLFQHGLGADHRQPEEVFPAIAGVRRIVFECRGHGASDMGDPQRLSIDQFADDAVALLDHLGIDRAIFGGISLGAAIAIRVAAINAARVNGLILTRPAWVDRPSPETMDVYAEVGRLLADMGPQAGAAAFEASPALAKVEAVSPDNAASLRWFFTRANPDSTIELLTRVPGGWPGIERQAIQALNVPTLVIGNDQDFVHPLSYARELADLIPNARFVQVTSKTVDRKAYVAEYRAAIDQFLRGRLQ